MSPISVIKKYESNFTIMHIVYFTTLCIYNLNILCTYLHGLHTCYNKKKYYSNINITY